ncbi:MAG: PilZ domain-containing protein [Polyangiaceae bacterium]
MNAADLSGTTHFRAQSRKPVTLVGVLRPATIDVVGNRDVHVVDLGLGGAGVEVSDSVPVGTEVEIEIDTPHLWDPLTLSGVVAWELTLEAGGRRLGVRFKHGTGSSLRALAELLDAEAFG